VIAQIVGELAIAIEFAAVGLGLSDQIGGIMEQTHQAKHLQIQGHLT